MTSTVYIAKNVYGGDGLGRLGDGRVVFVPGAWAGENVKAEIVEEKKNFVKARLVEVVDASPDRCAPGETANLPGCVYDQLSSEGELKVKAQQLSEFFDRARIAVPALELQGPVAPVLHYRNKVVYHFAKQKGAWVLGYRKEPSHEIVDITTDPLAVEDINKKLPEIRAAVMALLTTGPMAVRKDVERKGNVTIRWSALSGVRWWVGDAPKDVTIRESTCGKVFEVPSDGFYQVNPKVGEALVQAVTAAYGANPTGELLDLYCGVGVFGLCSGAARVTGIESGRQAIDFARKNAQAQGVSARFFSEQVGRNLHRMPINARTTIVLDPPRGGLEPNVPMWLARSRVPRILYVSCDPATLMRDLRTITRNYTVDAVKWFNMFPRTARFETLVSMTLKK